jgi:hypothetical protein
MLRTNTYHLAKLTAVAFALQWAFIGNCLANADQESERCMAVRHHCENREATCDWLRNALKEDGVLCPGADPKSNPSDAFGPVTDEEYAGRCERALTACRNDDVACAKWRDAFNEHGSVCPGVNAPPSATRKGPTANSSTVPAHASSDTATSRAGDSLARLRSECDVAHGYKAFSAEVRCIENGIRVSQDFSATTVSDEIQLYTLTADNLVDEVGRKAMSPTAARVELQKAFLEFRDRSNRQNTEVAAKEEAVRLQAQATVATAKACSGCGTRA